MQFFYLVVFLACCGGQSRAYPRFQHDNADDFEDGYSADDTSGRSTRDVTTTRVAGFGAGGTSGASHPWQLAPPVKTRSYVAYRNPINHDEFFQRAKRKLFLQQQQQQQQASLSAEQAAIDSLNKQEKSTKMIAERPLSKVVAKHPPGPNTVIEEAVMMNKFKNSGYNPLPFGGPRTISNNFNAVPSVHDTEAEQERSSQAGGLPFSRRPTVRETEEKPREYRLPVPDSETHYRKPVNESILRAYHAVLSEDMPRSQALPLRKANVESFRVLVDVIKSLMNYSTTTTTTTTLSPFKDTDYIEDDDDE